MSKTKGLLFTAGIVLAMAFTFSCSGDDSGGGGGDGGYTGSYGSVEHDGKTYKTVQIGTQTWMAENLNYNPGTGTSACYENQDSNCDTYGRLYNWETAMTACPSGWRLPSKEAWEAMTAFIGGESTEGKKLKATSGWANRADGSSGNGTDEYGFSALPGGQGQSGGRFSGVDSFGTWWSASEDNSYDAYFRDIGVNANWYAFSKSGLHSVRCIKDS